MGNVLFCLCQFCLRAATVDLWPTWKTSDKTNSIHNSYPWLMGLKMSHWFYLIDRKKKKSWYKYCSIIWRVLSVILSLIIYCVLLCADCYGEHQSAEGVFGCSVHGQLQWLTELIHHLTIIPESQVSNSYLRITQENSKPVVPNLGALEISRGCKTHVRTVLPT